jgi:hypothetical protein
MISKDKHRISLQNSKSILSLFAFGVAREQPEQSDYPQKLYIMPSITRLPGLDERRQERCHFFFAEATFPKNA